MGIAVYIDYTDEGNDAAITAIEADANPVTDIVYRLPGEFEPAMADPLETVVYALDADTGILAACTAVGVTALSIDTVIA